MKLILLVMLVVNMVVAKDTFFGIDMLSKVDKTKFACENWLHGLELCQDKAKPETNVVSVITEKDGTIIGIINRSNQVGKPLPNVFENWTKPLFQKLTKKYGNFKCEDEGMIGEVCTAKYKNITIKLINNSIAPQVSYDHDKLLEAKGELRKAAVPNGI